VCSEGTVYKEPRNWGYPKKKGVQGEKSVFLACDSVVNFATRSVGSERLAGKVVASWVAKVP